MSDPETSKSAANAPAYKLTRPLPIFTPLSKQTKLATQAEKQRLKHEKHKATAAKQRIKKEKKAAVQARKRAKAISKQVREEREADERDADQGNGKKKESEIEKAFMGVLRRIIARFNVMKITGTKLGTEGEMLESSSETPQTCASLEASRRKLEVEHRERGGVEDGEEGEICETSPGRDDGDGYELRKSGPSCEDGRWRPEYLNKMRV